MLKKTLIRRSDVLRTFVKVTTQRDADRRIGERLGDEVSSALLAYLRIIILHQERHYISTKKVAGNKFGRGSDSGPPPPNTVKN